MQNRIENEIRYKYNEMEQKPCPLIIVKIAHDILNRSLHKKHAGSPYEPPGDTTW